ncbi:MFS general substrate transporter [Melanomma pulvis-pyrius CBS 109.77]|uniref:MFS general substrate transporter n=1 Tax=Melanomma pulvis-pyrius CBS 109.77 TaxID=1314802 RepID=A0A6A6WZ25_9PLEO|nr:MFS general substrate transporter [Melanomma pulvis-pyrius CBS 109.77]
MTERRLPVKQLAILSICRFAEPIALTSVYPYLPEMIESFGIPENDIAWWAGLTSAIFSLCQGFTSISWGAASDRFGRKPIILIGLVNTMIMMVVWGFSTNLPMAITARALQGLGNGNVGILRTMVAELCPWKELQPRAFSIMPLVYTIGAVFGPTLGGMFSNPLKVDPRHPRRDKFLERYPYALPNLVAASFFCISIATGWLFLKESLAAKRNDRDYGLIIGAKITAWFRKTFRISKRQKKLHSERQPLLANQKTLGDEEAAPGMSLIVHKTEKPPSIRDVLSYQTTLNLIVYTILAFYTISYDQLLPVFMHHPPQSLDDPKVSFPFKFSGGFGINSQRIGGIFTIFAISSMLCQFLIFPPLTQHLGVLTCLRISFLIFPFVFFVTPFIALLPTRFSKEMAMTVLLMIRGVGGTFAFPTSTILITNSAPSLRILGTLNGVATTVSALGRTAGPATCGSLFTYGLKKGYVIIPFWTLSAIALLACIPTFWLVEGKGFGDDPDPDVESVVSATASLEDSLEDSEDDANVSESEYGEPTNLLSYTSTHSSADVASDDDVDMSEGEGWSRHHGRRESSSTIGHVRSHSHGRRRISRTGRTLRRRSSVPLGMGTGFRRLSSNLGSTGIGAGGASWGGT